jgi:LAO/AO transport system kinase
MRSTLTPNDLAGSILRGDRLALARACTEVENGTAAGEAVISLLFRHSGQAHIVGVTGSPGTGKSSLVNRLARAYRDRHPEHKVAIIAVDPTSPFSGGAVLGDRVRMRDLSGDEKVFIRSMATRGALGGLARQTNALTRLFDCAGYQLILVETVGAGQSEVDIVRLAHTTLVVEAPGLGDDIQAIKAGILEIADILVVNKADHPGADATERSLRMMLELSHHRPKSDYGHHRAGDSNQAPDEDEEVGWLPPVLRTIATENTGITELLDQVTVHRAWLEVNDLWQSRERQRVRAELQVLIREMLFTAWQSGQPADALEEMIERVLAREVSPFEAVDRLISNHQ